MEDGVIRGRSLIGGWGYKREIFDWRRGYKRETFDWGRGYKRETFDWRRGGIRWTL